MRREKLEHLVTTGMIEVNAALLNSVKRWTYKVAQSSTRDRCTESDEIYIYIYIFA